MTVWLVVKHCECLRLVGSIRVWLTCPYYTTINRILKCMAAAVLAATHSDSLWECKAPQIFASLMQFVTNSSFSINELHFTEGASQDTVI